MPSERKIPFQTISGRPIERLYTADSIPAFDVERELGEPGSFPYTRGIHPTGYQGKLWTMRQFAGFGTPEDTNQRYRGLLAAGATGLSVAFDLPTLMGRDPDHALSLGEVGKCGVNVTSLADMEALFDGIALGDITTSMTINAPAPMVFAMYLVLAERLRIDWARLSGTIQNDILKEFIAQKEYIYPPRPSMRLITDIFAFCAAHVPRWNTISVSGYHIREAGATAAQELAFTLRDGIEYVQAGVDAGLEVDTFVPRMSFFFNAHSDFFEEIAKYRAARRIWARVMRERFGAKDERSLKLRFHAQTAGVSLTAQQPMINVMRTALQALSAVLGGANSLHTNSLDEALALPTAEAATLALRTQQILAYETGVTQAVDPFGGSYFVERLTREPRGGDGRVLPYDRQHGRHDCGDRARIPAARNRRKRVSFSTGRRRRAPGDRGRERICLGRRAGGADSADRRRCGPAAARQGRSSSTHEEQSRGDAGARQAAQGRSGRREHDARDSRRDAGLRHDWRNVRCAAGCLGRVSGASHNLGLACGCADAMADVKVNR